MSAANPAAQETRNPRLPASRFPGHEGSADEGRGHECVPAEDRTDQQDESVSSRPHGEERDARGGRVTRAARMR